MIKEVWLNDMPVSVHETGGKRYFSRVWNEGQMPKFRREILSRGSAGCLLPVSFFQERDERLVSWDITSYLPLREHIAKKRMSRWLCFTDEVLAVLQRLLSAMLECEDHLLFTSEMCISVDTIFVHSRGTDLKLIYEPAMEHCIFAEAFGKLLKDLEVISKDREWAVYSARIQKELEHNNPGFHALEKTLAELQQELAGTRWKGSAE